MMDFSHGSVTVCVSCLLMIVGVMIVFPSVSEAFDPLDEYGNITIKWDIIQWTGDGYVATVYIQNFQKYRHIESPGWHLGWTWKKNEIIWSMVGAQAKDQGDCSKFTGTIPHCCLKNPTIIDLMPGVSYSQQVANCCRGGVVSSYLQNPQKSVSSFQVVAGKAGTNNKTIRAPRNFTLWTPGGGYSCSATKKVKASSYLSSDGLRRTQVILTWQSVCQYSQFLSSKPTSCCVSMSSFYSDTIVPCPTCACACRNDPRQNGTCVDKDSSLLMNPGINTPNKDYSPLLQCTYHMCPIKVHWHVKVNYKLYWRVKVTVTNFNYKMNYSDWNLVVRHPSFGNITQVFSFSYLPVYPAGNSNDTAMFWGIKYFNDMLMEAGDTGNVQSEMILQKTNTFTFKSGWAFPSVIYFNGDNCAMPPPDQYPQLPNQASPAKQRFNFLTIFASFLFLCLFT